MEKIVISNLSENFSSLVNGDICEDSTHFKRIWYVEGNHNHFDAIYSVSYAKIRSEDENSRYYLGKALKFGVKLLTGMPLFVPTVEGTVHTFCHLIVDIVSAHSDVIKMKYDVSVSNGSITHKKNIRERELFSWKVRMESIKGLTINDKNITLSLKQFLNLGNRTINVTEISLKNNQLELAYC